MRDVGACPCGSGDGYPQCCGPLHSGARQAPTALSLMRSRFSAYALGDTAYLLATWHPDTRPERLELDPGMVWRRLQIVDTLAGEADAPEGVVEFRARFRHGGRGGILHERSRFIRHDTRWVYVDGAVMPLETMKA